MIYKCIQDDVFNYDNCYYAHCISRDFALGAGIAVAFRDKYDMVNKLNNYAKENPNDAFTCVLIDNVFNLITKKYCYQKPTYMSLKTSLLAMKEQIINRNDIKRLVMPKIGCGLDRLSWSKVEPMIKEVFDDLDIEIIVCYL